MSKRTSIYITPRTQSIIDTTMDSVSGRIATILERYDSIVTRHKPTLTAPEWCAVFDALNGCWLKDDATRFAWAEVEDTPDLDTKWGIDQQALVDYLREAPYAELVSIAEHTERFWRHSDLPLTEALTQIGITAD